MGDTTLMTTIVTAMTERTTEATDSEKELAEDLHFVMSGIVGPMICFFGIAGNILSMIVWSRRGMRSSTGRYFTGQAVADFGVLLFFLLIDSSVAWTPEIKRNKVFGIFYCYIGYPFFFFFIITSIWFTVGVTIDRYIMVCWITKAKRFCNERQANFGLLIITINCFLINIPHFVSFSPVLDRAPNDTGNTFEKTEFQSGSGGMFYEFWIHCIILILIPWSSVLTMNVRIINKISNSNKKMADKKSQASLKSTKQSENQITRCLLTVTFTFLFFIGIQCIVQCFFMQEPSWADMNKVSAAFAFAKTGILFNSASNFVLYCLTGRRFRNELFKMFGLLKKEAQLTSLVGTNSSGTTPTASTTSTTGI